jgi:hypothetical protein
LEKNLKKDELSYLVELSAKILPKNLECLDIEMLQR